MTVEPFAQTTDTQHWLLAVLCPDNTCCSAVLQIAGLQRAAQYGAPVTAEAIKSLPACLRNIWVREGLRGLYKGALPSCLKSAPATAVTFATYELCIRALLRADAAASAAERSEVA